MKKALYLFVIAVALAGGVVKNANASFVTVRPGQPLPPALIDFINRLREPTTQALHQILREHEVPEELMKNASLGVLSGAADLFRRGTLAPGRPMPNEPVKENTDLICYILNNYNIPELYLYRLVDLVDMSEIIKALPNCEIKDLILYNSFTNFNADVHLILKDIESLPPRLNRLILRDSDLTDDDMPELARLLRDVKLETLDIRGNPNITSVGLEVLHNILASHDTSVEVLLPDTLENQVFGDISSTVGSAAATSAGERLERTAQTRQRENTSATAAATSDDEEATPEPPAAKTARKAEDDNETN